MAVFLGDCLEHLKNMPDESVDLVYLDPPFFYTKKQRLKTRDNTKEYCFDDSWSSMPEYMQFMKKRLRECRRVLKQTGSIFLHCDKTASHHLRVALDDIFGMEHFQSEIIWVYRRWSNSKTGLLNNHQNIFFYSKTKKFKFNTIYTDYSPTTNVDQILQERIRDENQKSTYKVDDSGQIVWGKEKKAFRCLMFGIYRFLIQRPKKGRDIQPKSPFYCWSRSSKLQRRKGMPYWILFAEAGQRS